MSTLQDELRTAFEDEDYDVASVSVNRKHVRVQLLDADEADKDDLYECLYTVVDEDDILGSNLDTEAREGSATPLVVISFRYRR